MHAPGHLVAGAGQLEPVVAVVVVDVGIVRPHRGRADVEVPVQFRRRIAIGREAAAGRPVRVVPDLDHRDVAQPARLNDLDRLAIVLLAVLLRADLHDAIVLLGRLDQVASFADRVAQRLFEVHILAGLAGGHGDRHVPVGLRGDDHRVDVLVFQQLAEVVIRGDLFATGLLAACGQMVRVHVAHGDHPHAGQFHEAGHHLISAAGAAADQGHVDRVVGTRVGLCAGGVETRPGPGGCRRCRVVPRNSRRLC